MQAVPEHHLITPQLLRSWPLPAPTGGKEARGRILIGGGSAEVPGAVLLAAEAALRAGAGKLQIAAVASIAGSLSVRGAEALVRALAQGASVVLVGPGMTDAEETQGFTDRLLKHLECSVVLDALGMASVTADAACLHPLQGQAVLTPNPKELAIALHSEPADVEADPAGAALELARQAQATVGLGGATSWIASPTGSLWCDESGGAGLGVSGSGDVRAGVTAGLLARGAEPDQGARGAR